VFRRAQVRTIDEMMRILETLLDRFEVGYESSCGYGHYHDLLRPLASRVLVAHPGQLRVNFRSKEKNDRKDAERLAPAAWRRAKVFSGMSPPPSVRRARGAQGRRRGTTDKRDE
jgi:hypothetical protein